MIFVKMKLCSIDGKLIQYQDRDLEKVNLDLRKIWRVLGVKNLKNLFR